MIVTLRRILPASTAALLACASMSFAGPDASALPRDTHCTSLFVFDAGTCGEGEVPDWDVEYTDNSTSGICPPNNVCECTVTVELTAASGTRLTQNDKKKKTVNLTTQNCNTQDHQSAAVYSGFRSRA